jgi:hypothetical protein
MFNLNHSDRFLYCWFIPNLLLQNCPHESATTSTLNESLFSTFSRPDAWLKVAPHYPFGTAQRQWAKHGVCYSDLTSRARSEEAILKQQESYFQLQLDVFARFGQTPADFSTSIGSALTYPQLQEVLGAKGLLLHCEFVNNRPFLKAVSTCLTRDGTEIVDCPKNLSEDIMNLNSCSRTNDRVYIMSYKQLAQTASKNKISKDEL